MPKIFHVSDDPGIETFEPRPVPSTGSGVAGEAVWAVDEDHLPNYLVPRDCPRVTFAVGPMTTDQGRTWYRTQTEARRVVAIESDWFERAANATLFLYEMPAEPFAPSDANAGYFVAREPITPVEMTTLTDPIGEMLKRDVELRVLPSLWRLYDAVAASSLEFSIIRMRNAQPRVKKA